MIYKSHTVFVESGAIQLLLRIFSAPFFRPANSIESEHFVDSCWFRAENKMFLVKMDRLVCWDGATMTAIAFVLEV